MSIALETTKLGKRYGRKQALRDCTLQLPTGRVVALVGPNGAGKTTLLQLAVGLLGPSEGEVRVFGYDPRKQERDLLPHVGFLAQDHPLYKNFTVADLLTMGRKLNPRWDQQMAVERLKMLDIPLNRRAGRLSGGQQAQVALALALAKRPELMLLDEPLASMDPLALGVTAGALLRNTIPAMYVTLIVYPLVRTLIAQLVRSNYLPPYSTGAIDPYIKTPKTLPGNQDWVIAITWTDHAGHIISDSQIGKACNVPALAFNRFPLTLNISVPFNCTHAHGWLQTIIWQPIDRIWLFQGIESAIFFGLAAGLLALTYWWVRQRIS